MRRKCRLFSAGYWKGPRSAQLHLDQIRTSTSKCLVEKPLPIVKMGQLHSKPFGQAESLSESVRIVMGFLVSLGELYAGAADSPGSLTVNLSIACFSELDEPGFLIPVKND